MSAAGWLAVVGVGPGDPAWITPETAALIESATDLVGYASYVARVAEHGHTRHVSDNREELARARQALFGVAHHHVEYAARVAAPLGLDRGAVIGAVEHGQLVGL